VPSGGCGALSRGDFRGGRSAATGPCRVLGYHGAMPDAWTQILDALNKIVSPDWSTVIAVLPILGIIGLIGPVLSLLALAWFRYLLTRRRGHVRLSEIVVRAAARDAGGAPIVPANVPYCQRDALVYGPRETRCPTCRDGLVVRCPVDGTVRAATRQACATCGTRYVLGNLPTLVAPPSAGPPAGGAAAA